MSYRQATKSAPNTTVYYVLSKSRPDKEHTVIHVKTPHVNRWVCSCETFYHRQLVKGLIKPKQVRHCLHIREIRTAIEMGHRVA